MASLLIFLSGASLLGLMFLLPLYYQQVRGVDPLRAGLLLAPQGVGMVLALAVVGTLVDRLGPRSIVLTGIAVTIVGTVPFTQTAAVDPSLLGAALVLRGMGLGAAAMPLTAAAYRALAEDEVPRAAGALVIAQRLGASLGTAVLAFVLQREIGRRAGDGVPDAVALAEAFGHAFWWTIVLSAAALLPAVALPGRATGPARGR